MMVVVTIEIWPGGDEQKARPLGVATIVNDGTGDASHGNYDVALSHSGAYYGKEGIYKSGRVEKFRRRFSPYHLVRAALNACLK